MQWSAHTVAHRSNPALPVLHNPCSKNAFYIFKLYQKNQKKDTFMTYKSFMKCNASLHK